MYQIFLSPSRSLDDGQTMASVLEILPACVSLTALELWCVSTPVLLVLALLLAVFRNKRSVSPPLSQVLKKRGGKGEEEEEGDPLVSFFFSMPFFIFVFIFSPFPQMFPALQP